MIFKSIIGVTCFCLAAASLSAYSALVSSFTFQAETTYCISEISSDCTDIFTNGLSGDFSVDLSFLDASGNGNITWNNFLDFDATNSVSSWSLANITDGGVDFNNWMFTDFGIEALPDFSNGWVSPTDGGGEKLVITGFGVSNSAPASSWASSNPGEYCPSTDQYYPNLEPCPGGTVYVETYGISADYSIPVISASVSITVNNVLVVDAGTDQQITEGDIVQLNGFNSLDVNDMIVSYLWTQTEGPTVILDDSTSATPSFIAPAVEDTTLLVFKLIASDSNGSQDYDTTFINVRDELLTSIAPPLDVQLIDTVVPGNTLYQFDTLSDPFFASTNVQWNQVNGPTVTLSDANAEIPSFMTPAVSADSATTFEVRSTDIDGLVVRAGVNVNILGTTSVNQAPTANAGIDQVMTEGDTVNLDATASTDSDGSIVSYYWQQTGGPMVVLTSIMEAQPSFVAPAIAAVDDGTELTFELVVTDDGGFMDRQSVTITILDNGIIAFADDVTTIISSSGDPIGIQTIMGGSLIALKAVDPVTIVDDVNRPDLLPYGLLDFSLRVEPGATVQVSFALQSAAGTNLNWWKYVIGSGWLDYSANTTFNAARDVMTITLTDNGIGDDDPTPGVIRDPGGLALASAAAIGGSSTSGGGGGSMSPLLLMFLLLGFYARIIVKVHYYQVNTFPRRCTGKVRKVCA